MVIELDEPVVVVQYDASWPNQFAAERLRLIGALANTEVEIEHIGSTAVPGLVAKPVIDILVGLVSPKPASQVASALSELGYDPLGEVGVPGRLYFRHRSSSQSFNVHVVAHGGQLWFDNLALRDYLRTHPAEAEAYALAKTRAAERAPDSLIRYSGLKARLVEAPLDRARCQESQPPPR